MATAEDFKEVAETTSGKNFTDFFNQWYYGEGYPTFNVTYIRQGVDSIILLINQTTSSAVTPFFKGLYEFTINSAQGDTTVKLYMNSNNQLFKFKYNKIPSGVIVDPNNWVLNATGIITNGGVIPVKLLSFEGNATANCNALLKWKTSNEENSQQYIVEYSSDGINYIPSGSISSHQSTIESNYELASSLNSSPIHYFRLKIVNTDGSFTYSQVIKIQQSCKGSFSFNVAPNPVTETVTLAVNQPMTGEIKIRVFNATGQLIHKEHTLIEAGTHMISITALKKLSPGTYTISIETSTVVMKRRFIKL